MHSKRLIRYYCDHCHKGMFRAKTMPKHERHCTKNLYRICRVCVLMGNSQPNLLRLVNFLKEQMHGDNSITQNGDIGEILIKLKEMAGNCPACVLSAIRQSKTYKTFKNYFNYKTEMENFFKKRMERMLTGMPVPEPPRIETNYVVNQAAALRQSYQHDYNYIRGQDILIERAAVVESDVLF